MLNLYPYTDAHELNLDFLLSKMKELDINVYELKEKLDSMGDDLQAQIDYLTDWVNNYSDAWAKSVIEKYLATMIFVEISSAGYIIYYIPDSWDEISFNTTGLDISITGIEYGHLVLSY